MSYTGKFRTSTVLKADKDGKLPSSIKVLPRGVFQTTKYGELQITEKVMDEMVASFRPQERPVSIDRDHAPLGDTRAAGWIEKLVKAEDGLYADVEWTPYGEKLVGNREYRMLSPEWSYDYVDSEDSQEMGAALLAVALTNRPLFKSIGVLTASDLTTGERLFILESNSMNIQDILAKKTADRSEEEVKFLADHKAEMNEEQTNQYEAEQGEGKKEAKSESKEEKKTKQADNKETTKEGKEETVTISASELESYKAQEARIKALEEESLKASIKSKVDSYIANDKKETRILPTSKDKVVTFLLSLNESQREAFYEIADELPGNKIVGEIGNGEGENSSLTADQKLAKLVAEAMKADSKLTEYDARKQVLKENKELREKINEQE